MENAGYNAKGSLSFLLVLNGGAIIGGLLASKIADVTGPQRVVATTFGLAALALLLFTFGFPLPVLLASVAHRGCRNHRYSGSDLRIRVQLLFDGRSGRRCRVVRRIRDVWAGYSGH